METAEELEAEFRSIALRCVANERDRQDRKWGPLLTRDFSAKSALAVIVEEIGEVARAICDRERADYRDELVQVAACAVAAIQSLDATPPDADWRNGESAPKET